MFCRPDPGPDAGPQAHIYRVMYIYRGMSFDEGCLEAFKAAKVLRQEKVNKGVMKPYTGIEVGFYSINRLNWE